MDPIVPQPQSDPTPNADGAPSFTSPQPADSIPAPDMQSSPSVISPITGAPVAASAASTGPELSPDVVSMSAESPGPQMAPAVSSPSPQPVAPAAAAAQPAAPIVGGMVAPAQAGSFETPPQQNQAPGTVQSFGQPTPPKKGHFGKKPIVIIAVILLVLLASAAVAYFFYVVPNKPANIWNKAMSNSAQGYDKLSEYATNYKSAKANKVDGSFKVTGSMAADGTIKGASDSEGNAEATVNFSTAGVKVTADVKTINASTTSENPDIYLKVDGIQGIGSLLGAGNAEFAQAMNSLNNKWYVIDHSMLDQYSGMVGSSNGIKRENLNKFLKSVSATNKKYLFTGDTQTSILVMKEAVGKETVDGRSTYHYKVGYNKANLKAYVTQLCNDFKDSNLASSDSASAAQISDCGSVGKEVDNIDDSTTSDVWVDMKTKLIHTFRFSDKANAADNYVDLSQNYTGGDEFPLSVKFHGKEGSEVSEFNLGLTINMKTNLIKVTGDYKVTGSSNENGQMSLTITPTEEEVKIIKPVGAKSFIELLNDFGLPSDALAPAPVTQPTSSTTPTTLQ